MGYSLRLDLHPVGDDSDQALTEADGPNTMILTDVLSLEVEK